MASDKDQKAKGYYADLEISQTGESGIEPVAYAPKKYSTGRIITGLVILAFIGGAIAAGVIFFKAKDTHDDHTPKSEWKDRSIYFLLTDRFSCSTNSTICDVNCTNLREFCGGTYEGIVNHLDYITDMGFDAIWINPIPNNTDDPNAGQGFHGYWAHDWYTLNSHFGDQWAMRRFIDECHKRDVLVMLDVVGNHVGPISPEFPIETFAPFNNLDFFHPGCSQEDYAKIATLPGNYSFPGYDQSLLENCPLYNLPDLRTEDETVQMLLNDWVRDTINNFHFDAIRIDTACYVGQPFWKSYTEAAGVFSIGEITTMNYSYLASYQTSGAMDSVLSYPAYFILQRVFMLKNESESMTLLADLYASNAEAFDDVSVLGLFVDNHDQPRVLDQIDEDYAILRNTLSYIFFMPGIPIIYYGTEAGLVGRDESYSDQWGSCGDKKGGDPCNREDMWSGSKWGAYNTTNELYTFIRTINLFRKQEKISRQPMMEVGYDDDYYAFTRGHVLVAITNIGNTTGTEIPVTLNMTQANTDAWNWDGKVLVNLLDEDDVVRVNPTTGLAKIYLRDGEPKIYYPYQ